MKRKLTGLILLVAIFGALCTSCSAMHHGAPPPPPAPPASPSTPK